ncbi:MAG: leucyl/phenylalanyl-tRNA--protein transferase [Alphaproteobacteria bacterium]|nr:MAG: leucyl/phenylalanyl-tRNA--protein transferase [Alphaproteobacteria bacterium]
MAYSVQFPDPNLAEDEGLVAVGGNLDLAYLISAYAQGVFPWYSEGEPILWWSPNPRMVLIPNAFKISKSLKQTINSGKFYIQFDTNFSDVIANCSAKKRKGQSGTWITNDIMNAYTELHRQGYAHSVETYCGKKLVGGLYGVTLGKAFFGESMFYHERDASKFALYNLCRLLVKWDFHFIDVQQSTNHLRSLGATDIERSKFLEMLRTALDYPTRREKWEHSL